MDYTKKPEDPLFRECVHTPLNENELAFYLRLAWKKIYNIEPTKEQLCILWCHTSLETGRGQFIYNNNFGNIKKRDNKTYTSYKCNEIINGKAEWFVPYHPQTFFQHWDSPAEGAEAYLQFLSKPRYQEALEMLKAGDIIQYTSKLKKGGYFTANLDYYTNLMVKLSKSFNKKSDVFMSYVPDGFVLPEDETEVIDIDIYDELEEKANEAKTVENSSQPEKYQPRNSMNPSALAKPIEKKIEVKKQNWLEALLSILNKIFSLFKK
jgi:hypothetical protein